MRHSYFFFVSRAVFLSFLLLVPDAGAQSIPEEQLASYSIPAVFQVVAAVEAELEFPLFQVDPQTLKPYVYYEGANGLLVDYIRKSIEGNQSIAFIRSELESVGWAKEDIDAAVRVALQSQPPGRKFERLAVKKVLATGTAFAVHEDGYLLTNAHVVEGSTSDSIRALLINDVLTQYGWQAAGDYGLNSDEQYVFEEKLYGYLQEKGRLVKMEHKYFVVPPSLLTLDVWDEDGFAQWWPAELKKAGKAYPGKDVAILKIDKAPIPALSVAENLPKVGEKIFALGYPAGANINTQSTNEPSLTSGIVSALKKSDNNDFEIVQTDVSIGGGSSGGPVLNRRGEVVGIVTLGNINFNLYGNFNFFLPISLAQELISSAKIPAPATGKATASYRQAVSLLLKGDCEGGRKKVADLQKILDSRFIDRILEDCYRGEGDGEEKSGFPFVDSSTALFLGGLVIGGVLAAGAWAVVRLFRKRRERLLM